MTRARTTALVAAGALAGGAAIVGTTAPWSPVASAPTGGAVRGSDDRPATPPVLAAPAPAPAPAQPVTAPAAEPPARSVWRADGSDAFRSTPGNRVGAPQPLLDDDQVSCVVTGPGQRCEVEPDLPAVREGDEHEVAVAVRLDRDFPVDAPGHQVIARWENDSPGWAPLDLRVHDGQLVLHGGGGHPSGPRTFTWVLGPAPTEDWARLHVRVHFSADPARGGVSVWRDGRIVVDDEHPPGGTLYPGQQSHLKAGLHRDRTIATPNAVQFRDWSVEHAGAARDEDPGPREETSTDDLRGEEPEGREASDDREAPRREGSNERGMSDDRETSDDREGPDDRETSDDPEGLRDPKASGDRRAPDERSTSRGSSAAAGASARGSSADEAGDAPRGDTSRGSAREPDPDAPGDRRGSRAEPGPPGQGRQQSAPRRAVTAPPAP